MKRTKYMSEQEVRQLRNACKRRVNEDVMEGRSQGVKISFVVDMALGTGLRVGELVLLSIEDIDFKRDIIHVQRQKKRRIVKDEIPLPENLKNHLRKYLKGRTSGPLFIGERGPLTVQGLQRIWKSAIREAKLPLSLSIHCARHTLAVLLLKKTKNLRVVQKQLGHSSPTITANLYADVQFDEMLDGINGVYD